MEGEDVTGKEVSNQKKRNRRCEKHPKRRIISICETCQSEPVCKKCLKTAHKGHELRNITEGEKHNDTNPVQNGHVGRAPRATFLTLTEIPELWTDTEKKQHYVQNETKELVASIEQYMHSIATNRKSLKCETDVVIGNITRQATLIKQQIDEVVKNFEKECRQLERSQNEWFTSVESSLASYATRLLQCDKKGKDLQFSDFNEVMSEIKQCRIDIEKLFLDHDELLSKIMVYSFTPARVSCADVENLFGELSDTEVQLSDNNLDMLYRSQTTPPCTSSPQEFPVQTMSRFSLGDEVVRSICSMSDGHSWVVREKQSLVFTDVLLTTCNGKQDEHSSVIFDTGVLDMTTDKNDVILTCCTDNTVRELMDDGNCAVLFRTNGRPESLCMLSNAAVVVCFYKKGRVIKFGHKGRIFNFIERDGNGVGFLTHPFRVRANKNNDTMAVLNADPYALIVVDKHLQLKFVYNGTTMDSATVKRKGGILTPPSVQIGPNDACFDTYNNIFVTDVITKSVVMLDPCGHFIGRILPGFLFPSAVNVDISGHLWIGNYSGVIQVVKYTDGEREIQ